jgi:hypothetical protein
MTSSHRSIYQYQIQLPMKPKDNRGGKRAGAGRKKGEPTTVFQIRVKEKHLDNLQVIVKRFLNEQKIRDKYLTPEKKA